MYADSNQTDIELVGEMCFPNLAFDTQEVQFGSILNDTTGRHSVLMTNTSKVDAAFDWQFIEVERFDEEEGMPYVYLRSVTFSSFAVCTQLTAVRLVNTLLYTILARICLSYDLHCDLADASAQTAASM